MSLSQPYYDINRDDPHYADRVKAQIGYASDEAGSHRIDPNSYQLQHYGQLYSDAMQGGRTVGNRQGAQIATGPQDQVRSQQMQLGNYLAQRAMGTGGPSAAELQMQRGNEANMAQAMSMAASQHGQNAGAGLRQVAQQRALTTQQGVADAASLRANEQMQAQNSLGQLLAGTRGQDVGLATGQAQLNQQQGAQNDAMTQYYLNMGFNLDQARMAGQQAMEGAYAQRYGLDRNLAVQTSGQQTQLLGAGIAAGGSLISNLASAYSDERLKKDIRSAEGDTYSFLDALNASRYRYKDKGIDGDKERVSVMAQELEKTDLGKGMVLETPKGKAVDYGKGFGTLLAAQASLHKRLKALEGS